MIKQVLKRYVALLVAFLMAVWLIPASSVSAFAADSVISGLSDGGIGLTYSGDGIWEANGKTISGSVTGVAQHGCDRAQTKSTTLTITNKKSSAAPLKFSYLVTLNGGSVKVTGSSGATVSWTSSGAYLETLAAGATVKIALTSAKGANTTSIAISDISMVLDVDATVTFKPVANGSYTVDGNSITDTYTTTESSAHAFALSATPAEGYKFFAWYSETDSRNLSTNANSSINFESDQTVYPVFISQDSALFDVGGTKFYDLNQADAYASEHGNKIVLDTTGTLSSGNYTISAANTLLIPFDAAGTTYEETPESAGNTWTTPKAYKTLTMSSGVALDIKGKLSLSAKHYAAGGGETNPGGAPTGNYGAIQMLDGSSMVVEDGASLYAWGYVYGGGSVLAKSGSNVYENMQISGFKGGTATGAMLGNAQKVFPFCQYFIQNIEVPLTFESGAKETLYSSLYLPRFERVIGTSVSFIGSDGMFRMSNGTTLTKTYYPDTDWLSFELNGSAAINALKVSLVGQSVDSGSYVLPIMNNWDFELKSGSLSLNQDMAFLPGLTATIDKGAVMSIASGKNLYVYDSDSWNGLGVSTISYSPSEHKTRTAADLTDVKLTVNGTFEADGYFYTTGDGADISSDGSGKVEFTSGAGTNTTTYQVKSGGSTEYIDIPITSAKLHNGSQYAGTDDEYTDTSSAAAGTTYYYHKADEKWSTDNSVKVAFDANGGSGTMQDQSLKNGEEAQLSGNTFTKEGYTFAGWNTAADGSGTAYADQASVTLDEDITLYAQWKPAEYTITWNNADGTTLETDTVTYGETPSYTGAAPTKEADAQYTYTFKGWSPEVTAVTGDQTYTAVYDKTVRSYTVTWNNADGTTLVTDTVAYGDVPAYSGEIPTKPGDAQYSYTFKGWTPSVAAVSGDVTYTAEYTEKTNTYTVTWNNADGTTLETDTAAYGTVPSYMGAAPTKEADAQYTYAFKGWSPEIEAVTGNQTYTAEYTSTLRSYTVTWKNYDGSVLGTDNVDYGGTPAYNGETPSRNATEEYTYTFTGWDPAISMVTGDVSYTAQYKEEKRSYTITWKNDDGTVISTSTAEYGTTPKFEGSEPTKDADAEYEYTFTGWTPDYTEVAGDQTYTAEYVKTKRKYTVTWKNSDGSTLKTEQVEYGATPDFGGTPSIDADEHYTAVFKGWSPDVAAVSGDVTYTAVYTMAGEKHTVTFDANGGTGSMEAQTFEYGKDTALTANTFVRDHYIFKGWNTKADGTGNDYADGGSLSTLTEDMTLYAKWTPTGWNTDANGTTWYDSNGDRQYFGTWATIDGKTYYFDENGYIIKGLSSEITGQDGTTKGQYVFDASTGEFLSAQSGLYTSGDDTYWAKDGMVVPYAGLQKVTGTNGEVSYYYFGEDNKAVKNLPESGPDQWIPVEKTNGLLPSWGYHFDENGVILHNSDTSLNGFATVDGVKMYFINGVPAPMGMITVDGDTYYVTSKGVVMTGRSYYCSLLRTEAEQAAFPVITTAYKEGTYTFDSEGRMVQPEAPKNGIYEEDGSFYYYVNGTRTYGGVMKLDTDHAYYINASGEKAALTAGDYYAATSGEIVHAAAGTGTRKYWISKTNGLVTEKSYTFDEKGLMLDVPDTSKNGLYEESGSCWYYENGMRTYGGVMKLDADHAYYINASGGKVTLTAGYYYAATSGEIVRAAAGAGTRKYWISKTNDLLAEKSYTFDETGRITDAVEKKAETVNGIVEEDGSYYYYQKGLRTYGGVMKLENATYTAADGTQAALEDGYYYAATSGEIVHAAAGAGTRKYWISKTNGLLKEKSYTFDEKGRILDADDGK